MKLLVTGGCGFIGSHFVRMLLRRSGIRILNVDLLTYAGKGRNLIDVASNSRYRFVRMDIASPSIHKLVRDFRPDALINFAAESHVDRSVHDARPFLHANTLGVQNLLDAARAASIERFLQVSTDEVYGDVSKGHARENWPLAPSSPYSASKAGGDLLCLAAHRTHGQNVVITRCTNNYGPFQFPEKLIPLMITNALHHLPLPIYGDGRQRRDWIYVEDHCAGVWAALKKGKSGQIYNFGIGSEPTNIEIVRTILKLLNRPSSLMKHVQDRPGHDRRYALDSSKAKRELGWKPRFNLEQGLKSTVAWYQNHPRWWLRLKDEQFRKFYKQNYPLSAGR